MQLTILFFSIMSILLITITFLLVRMRQERIHLNDVHNARAIDLANSNTKLENLRGILKQSRDESVVTKKELNEYKQNPDRTLSMLGDLMNDHKVVLKVQRVEPSEIFLRSPRDSQ